MDQTQCMSPEGVLGTVRAFIIDNFLFGRDDQALAEDTSFLESGIIDSTGILELVAFVEDRYGIKIADDELLPENLDSLKSIASYVVRKCRENRR